MRSELIYKALGPVRNRYALCQLASQATRKFHRPATRIQDTTNEVLTRISTAKPQQVMTAEPVAVASERRRAA